MGALVGRLYAAGISEAKLTEMLGGLRIDNFSRTGSPPKLFKRPGTFSNTCSRITEQVLRHPPGTS
jgi:hypothetical protein